MKKTWLIILSVFMVLFALTATAWLLAEKLNQKTPAEKIALAREKLSEARAAGAGTYSTLFFSEATALYDSANLSWKQQNERLFFRRDFSKPTLFAKLSAEKSELAKKVAISYSRDLKKNLEKKLKFINERCLLFEKQFSDLPLTSDVRHSYQSARLNLKEAELAFNNLNYNVCHEKLKTANDEVDFIFTSTKSLLEDYFTMFKVWLGWNDEAVKYSAAHRDYALVISKFQKKCFVYYKGNEVAAFDIELGKNWIGDKRFKGDKTTPEGNYKIQKKKSGTQTKYYKALLLDFPNSDDKKRFAAEKKNGTLAINKEIGGLIEIHGDGGKETNWTDGCIALKNEDMDWLFAKVKEGTPIIIVGSLQPLETMIKW